jgi:hypothetical protein
MWIFMAAHAISAEPICRSRALPMECAIVNWKRGTAAWCSSTCARDRSCAGAPDQGTMRSCRKSRIDE